MKKLFLFCTATLLVFTNISYADTLTGSENAPVTQQPENTHAGSANTPVDQQPTVAKIDTNKQLRENQQNTTEENGSLYENIRSGWNKFIDFLAGPTR